VNCNDPTRLDSNARLLGAHDFDHRSVVALKELAQLSATARFEHRRMSRMLLPSRTWGRADWARMAARRSVATHRDPVQGLAVCGLERLDPPA
jgi:hypothetical protein